MAKGSGIKIGPNDIGTFFNHQPRIPDGTVVNINTVRGPTDPIFKDLYRVAVPMIATKSLAELQLEGFVVTGLKAIDEDRLNFPTVVHLSINRMLEIYLAGYEIHIMDPNDHVKVYEAIQGYLAHWADNSSKGAIHRATIPKDDLDDLDGFAGAIYEELRTKYDAITLPNAPGLPFLQGVDVLEEMAYTANAIVEGSRNNLPERESLSSMFKGGLNGALP